MTSQINMDSEDYDEFLCRVAKTLYYGNTSSFDSVSVPLTELAAEIYNEVKKENTLERLHAQEVTEIYENACVSTCSLVLAILYLEKIKSINPEYVEKVAPSELFLVSLLIASKFLNDDGEEDAVTNSEWAACSGLSLKTVNKIEKEFLDAIKWEVYISDELFWSRLLTMERYLANQEGKRRGWYSYTEFNILITAHELLILKRLLKYSALCVTCYAGSVLSLIGAALIAVRMKHLVLNCILCLFINRAIDERHVTSLSTSSNSTMDVPSLDNISVVLDADESIAENNSDVEVICDDSWSECAHADTSKLLSFKSGQLPPYLYSRLLKHATLYKSNVLSRNSLFHSRHSWPNL